MLFFSIGVQDYDQLINLVIVVGRPKKTLYPSRMLTWPGCVGFPLDMIFTTVQGLHTPSARRLDCYIGSELEGPLRLTRREGRGDIFFKRQLHCNWIPAV